MAAELQEALDHGQYAEALTLALDGDYAPETSFVRQLKWLNSAEPSAELLAGITDHAFVAAAVLDRLSDSLDSQKRLLDLGLEATAADAPRSGPARRELLRLQDRLRTYEELYSGQGTAEPAAEEEDAWGVELDEEAPPTASTSDRAALPVISFLKSDLWSLASQYAAAGDTRSLRILLLRHGNELDAAQRLQVADALPLHIEALDFFDVVPSPKAPAKTTPWRTEPDWSETNETPAPHMQLTPEMLSLRVVERIEGVEAATGMVELCLSLVQHGAARGVTGLESLGEDLSLLSSLVYDRPEPASGEDVDDWDLASWRGAEPSSLVSAYLAYSTEASVVGDIQRLLRPYLFVLEARNERAGKPDPQLQTRLLHDYILSAPLTHVKSILQASLPTMAVSRRVVKDNVDLARLAISCLYASSSLEDWSIMSAIFECMPSFDSAATDASGVSLLAPTLRASASPQRIFAALSGCPTSVVTTLLDTLEIHLDAGETLARWNAPQPLRWFITSAGDQQEQRQWCLRMVRKGGMSAESEDEWVALLEDAVRLAAPDSAFAALSKEEVTRTFFEALLGAGSFSLAKSLLNPSTGERPLQPVEVQELVLKTSRELYDNAVSGNLHVGDMKLAFECLSVAPQTPVIRQERDFIEATSRLCSFNLPDQPAPIEIRLAEDRLALVSRVLEQHHDAFRHADVMIDLVAKLLGTSSPLSEVRTLGMIVDAALSKGEYVMAAEACERMVGVLPRAKSAASTDVVWRKCAAVGNASSYPDLDRRMRLLGRAMLLAPESEISKTLLPAWRAVESAPRTNTVPITLRSDAARNAEAAARAAVSFGKAATAFIRPLTPSEQEKSRSPPPPSAAFDQLAADPHGRFGVREAMSKRFTAGVGWLIGAEADELTEGSR